MLGGAVRLGCERRPGGQGVVPERFETLQPRGDAAVEGEHRVEAGEDPLVGVEPRVGRPVCHRRVDPLIGVAEERRLEARTAAEPGDVVEP